MYCKAILIISFISVVLTGCRNNVQETPTVNTEVSSANSELVDESTNLEAKKSLQNDDEYHFTYNNMLLSGPNKKINMEEERDNWVSFYLDGDYVIITDALSVEEVKDDEERKSFLEKFCKDVINGMDGVNGIGYSFLTAPEGTIICKGKYIVGSDLKTTPNALYLIDTGTEITTVSYMAADGSENAEILDAMISNITYE